jgi:hypothetical protein
MHIYHKEINIFHKLCYLIVAISSILGGILLVQWNNFSLEGVTDVSVTRSLLLNIDAALLTFNSTPLW